MTNKNILKDALLVDGNNMLHRAYWKFKNMRNRKGEITSMIYGLPFILKSLIIKFGPDEVVVAFDGGKSKHRLAILPTYKAREQKLGFDLENFAKQKDVVIELLQALGVKVLYKRNYEADDLIYYACRKNTLKNLKTTIVSADKDFKQLLTPLVQIWDPSKEILFTPEILKRETGLLPNQIVDFLAMVGDDSDKIPGYKGMGEVGTLDFLNRYTSIANYLESGEQYRKIDNNLLRDIYKRNRKLIDIKYYYRKHLMGKIDYPILNPQPKFNQKKLQAICAEYNIRFFLQHDFIKPFKDLL